MAPSATRAGRACAAPRALALALLVSALRAAPAAAQALAVFEERLRHAAAEQARSEADQAALVAQAERECDAIERAKSAQPGPRAGAELERLLRAFEGLAVRLDAAEARVAAERAARARAHADFEAAAEREEQRLARLSGGQPGALLELGAARARAAALAPEAPPARPALDVRADDADGPEQLAAKLELLDAEVARLDAELANAARTQTLLGARLDARRLQARDLGRARRQGAGRLTLLERAADAARASLADLEARVHAAQRVHGDLQRGLQSLAERREDLRRRLERLRGHAVAGREVP